MYEERKERSGWFGYGRGDGETLDEAYGRVTNPQRFLPLHTAMLEMTGQLVMTSKSRSRKGMVSTRTW